MCGRRWGKTAFGIAEAGDGVANGQHWGWFSPSYKFSSEVWREMVTLLAPITLSKNAQEYRIETINGGVFELWTMQGVSADDVARGRKYHGVVVDEAGLLPNLVEVFNAAIRATLIDYKGTALFLGTPKGRRHGFVQLFARGEAKDGEWRSFTAATIDNPYIDPEEVEAARRELPEHVFNQEFLAIPSDDGLSPFGLAEIKAAIQPPSKNQTVCFGVDLASAQDYTVVWGVDEYGAHTGCHRWQAPWNDTKTRLRSLIRGYPTMIDSTGVGSPIVQDLQMIGLDVHPYVFHVASKRQLIQRLITGFAAKLFTIPQESEAEFKALEVEYTSQGKVKYSSPVGVHDDYVMAAGLALTMYERMGVVARWDTRIAVDYVAARIDPDANPELQRALLQQQKEYEQWEERDNDMQFNF